MLLNVKLTNWGSNLLGYFPQKAATNYRVSLPPTYKIEKKTLKSTSFSSVLSGWERESKMYSYQVRLV